ncbi:styrene monooxygenase/indole monooxygenase family protein [Actinosynnema sp. NPDC047251]|uniref:Oxygenase subunit protein n=1 Tax=Saccharothrix espanaensis (strain ATCC 51144 / DSM 44229 / JCM 9112 / NBRC 15066 / NRRL 15764) TaxID=1179773 RepID=K0JVW0_SACES|nr:styrene monooxygenase/indole monooxygenase family protein [Saccharothrix espanaensis]CCH31985.1 Oxygenase subunit protein [Saccharothrix espanaensis DSM 44229]
MRKVLVVGAGQSGLQLALGLVANGYDVTVMSARTPEEIRAGRVMSTQCMFGPSLAHERDLGLDLWAGHAPDVTGIGLSVAAPDERGGRVRALDWWARLDERAQSVDQRVKMAGWLELLEDRGGNVVYHGVTTADLNSLTRMYDLVVVAAGKGELVQAFSRDAGRSPYTAPQRILSVAYVHGLAPRPEHPEEHVVRFNAVPGVGELFVIPALTLSGPCDILFFEGVPGGQLDCWDDRPGPAEHLRRMLDLVREFVPWEYERCGSVELTDARATLTGAYAPVVRKPVGVLPSGGRVLGMADVVVANDPITGQGSNNAAKCAASYLDSILARGGEPFDEAWMTEVFESYWDDARHATTWTNAMLQPPPEHIMRIFGTARDVPAVAGRFVNAFADPSDLAQWFYDPESADRYLTSVTGG